MVAAENLYTANDLWELSQQYPDKEYELWEGIVIEVSPTGGESTELALELGRVIGNHNRTHKLGHVVGADGSFQLAPKTVLIPDVAFISKERLPKVPKGYIPVAPDLAVEVVSPTDAMKAVHRKAMKYLAYGVKMVWVVYPEDKTVDVYLPTADGQALVTELDINGVLKGGDILPGFEVSIREIFEVLED